MTGYATADTIGTRETVNQLTRKLESQGHKLEMDNFFSLPNLFNDLTNRKSTAATKPTNKKPKQNDIHAGQEMI
jgi:hypothetical protein